MSAKRDRRTEREHEAVYRKNRSEMAMECPVTGCGYITPIGPVASADADLKRHRLEVHESKP